jgi:uncharacterized protein (TIGR03382 family)
MESGSYDGSFGEGAADVVAFIQSRDNIIAPYFTTSGGGIRDVGPDRVYPTDYVDWDIHSNGLIFGGSMWDLWPLLEAAEGTTAGTASLETIFVGTMRGGPTIETCYDEAIVADDDDGDLGNGTPHYCDIVEAFGRHGLGPTGNGGAPIQMIDDPGIVQPSDADIPLAIDLVNVAEECFAWTPAGGTITWRAGGGSWTDTPLASVTASTATGAIPPQAAGTFVEYWVTIQGTDGSEISMPAGEDINPFSFYAGDVIEVYCEDFEANDGGYTHELVDGEDTLGADDWQWGVPLGEGGDPNAAYSGRYVWGNDLGEADYNGEYQNEKTNRLTSPAIDTAHYQGAFLAFRRWLNVEDGRYDNARIFADDDVVWDNHSSAAGDEHHRDTAWAPHAIDLEGAADDGEVVLAWEIESDQGLTMGGWTLDDVCIYAPATPDNRLGIHDFAATDGETGGVTLTWTNPLHDPLERVVVVRKEGSWPTGPTDGAVVFEDGAPVVAAPISVLDVDVDDDVVYSYAVYAHDGDLWLSYTIQGMNADLGSADMPVEETGGPDLERGGCACGTTAPAGSWTAGLALLALLQRRRR